MPLTKARHNLCHSLASNIRSQWNRGAATCGNTYCHGNFLGGYAANAPIWTAPSQAACGSCHDDGNSPADLKGRQDKHVSE